METSLNPYENIESWWGEPISEQLIKRIVTAPAKHLNLFLEGYSHLETETLPSLKQGFLRPIITHTTYGKYEEATTPLAYLKPVTNVLLYSHEVAVESPLSFLSPTFRDDIAYALQSLLHLKPLFESEVVHFFDTNSRTRHPSRSHRFTLLEPSLDPAHPDTRQVAELINKIESRKRSYELIDLMFNLRSVVGTVLQMAADQPGKFHQLIRNDEELLLYKIALIRASRIDTDNHAIRLRPLVSLDIPRLQESARTLVELRQSSDDFADWRAAMKIALDHIRGIPRENEDWPTMSKEVILDSLEPIRTRLEKHTKRSPLLTSLSKGITSFSFSGVGAVAGYTTGGSLISSLAAASAGKAAEVASEYVKAARKKRHDRAILDLILSFRN